MNILRISCRHYNYEFCFYGQKILGTFFSIIISCRVSRLAAVGLRPGSSLSPSGEAYVRLLVCLSVSVSVRVRLPVRACTCFVCRCVVKGCAAVRVEQVKRKA